MSFPGHYVAVFGGAVSGAEAAFQLAERGIKVVVFDQQALPYGKIEDGLPKWHAKLRNKEEGIINEKMKHDNVRYVPNTRLGQDVDFRDVVNNWGFSAVILATGAWGDRPLPIDGIDEYIGKGLTYQNPYIHWYNHKHEPDYRGSQYAVEDDTIVVGGGLASIDVVKVLMMEKVECALKERGIETHLFELDRGIDRVLEKNKLTLDDLGIKGCTLYYRRRPIDMPLSPMAADTPKLQTKAQMVREKVLGNAMRKFLFKFQGCHAPVDKVVEDGRLVGLVFQRTEIKDSKVIPIAGSEYEVNGSQVISSIGSIPVEIEGVPFEWQSFKIKDHESCKIEGFENVFAVGNAVTGRGNIKESFKHGHELSQKLMDDYLGWTPQDYENYQREKESTVGNEVNAIIEKLDKDNLLSAELVHVIEEKVSEAQQLHGYSDNYDAWLSEHLPVRLEDQLGLNH